MTQEFDSDFVRRIHAKEAVDGIFETAEVLEKTFPELVYRDLLTHAIESFLLGCCAAYAGAVETDGYLSSPEQTHKLAYQLFNVVVEDFNRRGKELKQNYLRRN